MKLVAATVIWLLCALNMLSIRVSAGVLRWSTWLKLGLIVVLVVWGLSLRLGSWSNFVPFIAQRSGSLPLLPALGAAMVGAFFSFGGWWDVSKISGEVRDPGHTLPHAMLFGTLAVTAVYILISAVFLYLVPLSRVSSNQTFVAQAGSVLFGSLGGKMFAAIVIVCVFSSLAALIMSSPRVYYAMAQDGLFFRRVSRISPRFGTPVSAIVIQGTISSVLVAVSSFQKIIEYFIFVAVVFLAMAGAGLFLARRRNAGTAPLFRTPLYPVPVLIFLLLISTLLVLLVGSSPIQAGLGGAVVLAGIPAYLLFRSGERLRQGEISRTEVPERA
jgi:APA family basic amino acid/polyamine antiporter